MIPSGITATASSAATDYPASTLVDWRYPRQIWRSTATTAQTITLDLGSALSHVGVYLRGANFTACTLAANATNSWGSPSVSVPVTLTYDALLKRYHRMVYWQASRAPITFRYIQLQISSQTPVDGAAYFALGAMLPANTATEAELRAPIRETVRQAMLKNELPTRREVQRIGDRQMMLSLPWNWAWDQITNSVDNETALMHALLTDEDEPVIVCWNVDTPERAILALRDGEISIDSQDGIGANMPLGFSELM